MTDSVVFLPEYFVISKICRTLHILELIRSPISYAIPYFVTADDEIIVTDTTLNLSANLLFLDIIRMTNDYDP